MDVGPKWNVVVGPETSVVNNCSRGFTFRVAYKFQEVQDEPSVVLVVETVSNGNTMGIEDNKSLVCHVKSVVQSIVESELTMKLEKADTVYEEQREKLDKLLLERKAELINLEGFILARKHGKDSDYLTQEQVVDLERRVWQYETCIDNEPNEKIHQHRANKFKLMRASFKMMKSNYIEMCNHLRAHYSNTKASGLRCFAMKKVSTDIKSTALQRKILN